VLAAILIDGMNFYNSNVIMMTINNCDSQSALHRQEIYSPQWLILCAMMHVMRDIAFAATDVASKIVTFLNANYLKYQVMVNFLYQVIS